MSIFGAQHTLKVYTADDDEYLHITEEGGAMSLTVKDTSTDAAVNKRVHVPYLTSGSFQLPYGATTADLPTGLGASDAGRCMFEVANDRLHIWNGTAWRHRQYNS